MQRVNLNDPSPPFAAPASSPSFEWGNRSGSDVLCALTAAYEEVVHWQGNIFTLPLGSVGKKFVEETTRLANAFAEGSALESVALLAMMIMPSLLLQAPHPAATHRDRVNCLARRMELWSAGQFEELMRECRAIRARLTYNQFTKNTPSEEDGTTRLFASYMRRGKVKAALRLLSSSGKGKVLSLDETLPIADGQEHSVRDVLADKHPPPGEVNPDALLSMPLSSATQNHTVIFDCLDHKVVRRAALHCQGSAGPSGMDASNWRRLCTLFHGASKKLCAAIAHMARRIATVQIDPQCLRPLIACRLIPLSKNPGVRPVGICETLRRLIGKGIMHVVGREIQSVVGTDQLCARQKSGCEAAVHAMSALYGRDIDGVLLVDATNAFNRVNRKVMMHNIRALCPSFATCVENFYRSNAELFVGGETLLSLEGTTQGDPLSMAIYALATLPLIRKAKSAQAAQCWFADDACAGAYIENLYNWWCTLRDLGPQYGYYVNPPKTWLVVKPASREAAVARFQDTGIQITSEGRPLLGGPLGTSVFIEEYIESATKSWVGEVETLAKIASVHPHPAYAAYTHGLANKWTYLARVNGTCQEHYSKLEKAVRTKLLSAICGRHVGDGERDLLSLPTRLGGLGITNPMVDAPQAHKEAMMITRPLVDILLGSPATPSTAFAAQLEVITATRKAHNKHVHDRAVSLRESLPDGSTTALSMRWAQEHGASTWLTALPLTAHGFNLTRREFLDALCLRYGWTPANLPSLCSCGRNFTVEHALSCMRGGYISLRHNEVRDLLAELLSETCHNVTTEPELQPLTVASQSSATNTSDCARLDIQASGFWGGSRFETAYFDVRVFNPYAASYRSTPPSRIFQSHDKQKRRQYEHRVQEVEGGSFTPLVFSTNGAAGRTSTVFLKRLASLLADKRDTTYAEAMGWLRCRLSFALLRASIMCIRGTRPRGRNPAIHDSNEPYHPSVALAEARVAWRSD